MLSTFLDGITPPPEIDLSKAGIKSNCKNVTVLSDLAYPKQWRVQGKYIEQVAKMTHWENPKAMERFRQKIQALGIAAKLS